MNVTERKIKANQENGKKGGVKTEEGKDISKMNSFKHGILSNTKTEFDELKSTPLFLALSEEFDAVTIHQKILVEELVSTYIKLSRCAKFQKQKLNQDMHSFDFQDSLNFTQIDDGYKAQIREDIFKSLELIMVRYEPQLVNRMIRLIKELKSLQNDQ